MLTYLKIMKILYQNVIMTSERKEFEVFPTQPEKSKVCIKHRLFSSTGRSGIHTIIVQTEIWIKKNQPKDSITGGRNLEPLITMCVFRFALGEKTQLGAYLGKGTYWQLITSCWLYFGVMFRI